MLALTGYNNAQGDALVIYTSSISNTAIYDTSSVDVTSTLVNAGILQELITPQPFHGWVRYRSTALALEITEHYLLMSEASNAGETPVFFARIENSSTQVCIQQADVASVVYTIYRYEQNTARQGGSGKTAITNWTNLTIPVSDCFFDAPISNDRRTTFAYNFRFEPDTTTENPFDTAGRYVIEFIITPTEGNKIPLIYNVTLN